LGIDSICTGFNYAENGGFIEQYLNAHSIPHDFVYAEGAVRTNIKICEQDTGVMTEVNQPGHYVPPEAEEALVNKVLFLTGCPCKPLRQPTNAFLVISGSRPQGVGTDIYRRIGKGSGGRIILDADGEALRTCLDNPPFLIKPNLFELESAFDVQLPTRKSIIEFCKKLIAGGIGMVCVSMGGDGALLITERGAYFAEALPLKIQGLAGAGDAMVAGLAYGLTLNAPPEEMLRMAAASASASVIREGTQMGTRAGYEEMLGRITVGKV
jgi:1-phosphofructokinase